MHNLAYLTDTTSTAQASQEHQGNDSKELRSPRREASCQGELRDDDAKPTARCCGAPCGRRAESCNIRLTCCGAPAGGGRRAESCSSERNKALTGLPNEGDMGEDSAKGVEARSGVPRMGWNPDVRNIDDTTVHGDLRRRHTPRDNGTCHLVEHHRRGKGSWPQRAKPPKRECDGRGNLYTTTSGPHLTVEELGST